MLRAKLGEKSKASILIRAMYMTPRTTTACVTGANEKEPVGVEGVTYIALILINIYRLKYSFKKPGQTMGNHGIAKP